MSSFAGFSEEDIKKLQNGITKEVNKPKGKQTLFKVS